MTAKCIGPVSTETVQAAYMPVSEYVDSSGFNHDDMRHPRWRHPIVPNDPEAPSELEKRLATAGILFERYGGRDGIRASFDATLLKIESGPYVPRWPDARGEYGIGWAPQYAIRDDFPRVGLEELVKRLGEIVRGA